MDGPSVLIFHRPAHPAEPASVRLLAEVRARVAEGQTRLLVAAGAVGVRWTGPSDDAGAPASFGEALARLAPRTGGVIVIGSGAVARLDVGDARRLVRVAAGGGRRALTNNRYSSDVCAISDSRVLQALPPLPSDNALPRWLEEHAGFALEELRGRERLALDLDTVQDIALWALAPGAPTWIRGLVSAEGIAIPRLAELRMLAADPRRELLVAGRSGSSTLRWLERNVRCRVRFLSEERGLRASSSMAIGPDGRSHSDVSRPPRATLGRLLAASGPQALGKLVAELADGAIIDSRVLLADRLGADEGAWPAPADRYASDLLEASAIADPWLRELTAAAAASPAPILLGAHTLIGPGIRLVLGQRRPSGASAALG